MPYLPEGPGYRRTDTSRDAAVQIAPAAPTYAERCLAILAEKGPMTPDEAATALNVSVLTIRPRFTELHQAGKIIDTSLRRANANGRNAIVWRLRDDVGVA